MQQTHILIIQWFLSMKLMAIDDNLLDTKKNQQLLFLWKTTARKKRVVSTNCRKYGERRATIQLSRPLTSLWLLSKRISVAAMCVAQSLQRILGVFVIHPTQKFQAVMVVAIKEMTGRKSVKIHWNLN